MDAVGAFSASLLEARAPAADQFHEISEANGSVVVQIPRALCLAGPPKGQQRDQVIKTHVATVVQICSAHFAKVDAKEQVIRTGGILFLQVVALEFVQRHFSRIQQKVMASLQVGIAEDHVIEVPRPEPTVVGTPGVSHALLGQSRNNVVQV